MQMGVSRASFFAFFLTAAAVIIVEVLNANGLVLPQGLWWYALGVTWLIVSAGYAFVIYIRAWMMAS